MPPMTLGRDKALITQFLERCNRYAEDKLAGYRRGLEGASADQALELQDKIGHWTAYRAFNEHAIGELAAGRLDDWFDEFELE